MEELKLNCLYPVLSFNQRLLLRKLVERQGRFEGVVTGAIKSGGSRQALALLAIEPITIPIAIGTQYPKSQHGSSVL